MSTTAAEQPRAVPHKRSGRAGAIWAMVRLGAINALHFRANVFVSIVSVILQTVLLVTVWRAVYAGRASVADITEEQAVGYAVLAVVIGHLTLPWMLSSLPERVRMGTVAVDVIRPVGVIGQNLAMTFGSLAGALPGVAAGIATGWALGGLQPPASAPHAALFAVALLLGLVLSVILNFAVGLTSFWTTDTRGPFYIYRTLASFGSGALVPLWFMPAGLAAALSWLPFQLQVFGPLQIWFGELDLRGGVQLLGAQLLWIGVAGLITLAVARRALVKVVIHGG